MTTRLLLIRHGESLWNPLSRYAGQRDVPLSQRGSEQAHRLARRLAEEPLTAIHSSPLQRARETATIVANRRGIPVFLDLGLVEISHGDWEGLTAAEVASQFPNEYALWQAHPHTVVMPGGEGLADVADRVQASLDRALNQQCEGSVAICAHDAVLRVMVLNCLDLGMDNFWKLSFENGSLSLLQSTDDRACGWKLVFLNDTSHLVGVSSEYALQAL